MGRKQGIQGRQGSGQKPKDREPLQIEAKSGRLAGEVVLDHRQLSSKIAKLGGSGIRAFLRIAQLWGLTAAQEQALLDVDAETMNQPRQDQDVTLDPNQLERISHILGIYGSLQIILPSSADEWVRKPNSAPMFGGRPALEVMLQGLAELRSVRVYLASQTV